jgi:hypothetical protein
MTASDRSGHCPNMTRPSRIVGAMALVGTAVSACGARSGLLVPDLGATTAENESESDGGTCTEASVGVEPNVPNLYFVLDISGSMLVDNKWDNVRGAAASLIKELGPNARFGAAVFPEPHGTNCQAGKEVMSLHLGDTQGAAANVFMGATALTPHGGTPTAATLQGLLPALRNFTSVTFVILATDGGPNCNHNVNMCSVDQCTSNIDGVMNPPNGPNCTRGGSPNCCDPAQTGSTAGLGCLDSDGTAQAVSELRAAGIQTYVMGIPGSSPYGPVLDQLAVAGGTARAGQPRYYAVNSPDEVALASGFEQIAAAAMRSCVLTLSDTVKNPDKLNVYVNGAVVPNGPDGWQLKGQTITLRGMTCTDFGTGPADAAAAPVLVTQGCPTVR